MWITFGEPKEDVLAPIELFPKIKAEFDKLENWRATLPASGQPLFVSLRNLGTPDILVMHPVGTLQVTQRSAPLNLPLDKIGNQKLSDVKNLTVTVQSSGLVATGSLREKFAVAQFREMDDAAKLSAPAFEPFDSGIELGATGRPWITGPAAQRNVRYESVVLDTAFQRFTIRFFEFWKSLFVHFRAGASVSRVAVSLATESRLQPFENKVAVSAEGYTVASSVDNRPHTATASFSSYAEAQAYMGQVTRADSSLSDALHVIPNAEVNAVP